MSVDVSGVPLAIQKQIYAKLTADATLMAKLTGTTKVVDFVPDNCTYPFVQIGEGDYQDWGGHDFDGFEATLQVNVWDRPSARGRAPVLSIQADLHRILHLAEFTIPNITTVVMRFQTSTVLVDLDAVTYHGVSRFRLIVGGNNV